MPDATVVSTKEINNVIMVKDVYIPALFEYLIQPACIACKGCIFLIYVKIAMLNFTPNYNRR